MIEIIRKPTRKALRDADAAKWLQTIPDINALTEPQIKAALVARDKNLWKGFDVWKTKQTIWAHRKRGPKRK